MRPELSWERVGDINNIIFVQGAVAVARPDGTIYLTYGAADRCVGAASVAVSELQEALRAALKTQCSPKVWPSELSLEDITRMR